MSIGCRENPVSFNLGVDDLGIIGRERERGKKEKEKERERNEGKKIMRAYRSPPSTRAYVPGRQCPCWRIGQPCDI